MCSVTKEKDKTHKQAKEENLSNSEVNSSNISAALSRNFTLRFPVQPGIMDVSVLGYLDDLMISD